MIKIWKGVEKEYVDKSLEVMTVFVCADIKVSFSLLHKILLDNKDIKSIYFGAGRKKFAGMSIDDWNELLSYCEHNNISIIIEIPPNELSAYIKYDYSNVTFIITYYNFPKSITNLYFKTDDFEVTKIFSAKAHIDITEVQNNRYPDDILIYEEE